LISLSATLYLFAAPIYGLVVLPWGEKREMAQQEARIAAREASLIEMRESAKIRAEAAQRLAELEMDALENASDETKEIVSPIVTPSDTLPSYTPFFFEGLFNDDGEPEIITPEQMHDWHYPIETER